MSKHNVNGLKHFVNDLVSISQENNGYLEVDVKSYLCFVEDARAAQIDKFLGHVDTKKRLLAIKQSTDFNVQRGGTFTEERSTDLNAPPRGAFTEEQSTDLNAPQRGAFTEEQSTDLYDPAVFGKKDTRDKVLEQGLVRTTRGRNGTTLVHIDVAIAHLIHICPEIEQFVIDTFKQFGRVMLAIEEGRTTDALEGLYEKSRKAIEKLLISEGIEPTKIRSQERLKSILSRIGFTKCIKDALGEERYERELSDTIRDITYDIYVAVFGLGAREMKEGLHFSNSKENTLRDCFSPSALLAVMSAEDSIIASINDGEIDIRDRRSWRAELDILQPHLRTIANKQGRRPQVMENTRVRGTVEEVGTHLGLLDSGETRTVFCKKLLTSV